MKKYWIILLLAAVSPAFCQSFRQQATHWSYWDRPEVLAASPEVTSTSATVGDILWLTQRVKGLSDQVQMLTRFAEMNPQYKLYQLDSELDLLERDQDPIGSFSDYFAVVVAEAYDIGATTEEVELRISRLLKLAQEGKFLSSHEQLLMHQGGIEAIRDYLRK